MIFRQDGAPSHHVRIATTTEESGLTLLNFLTWERVKFLIYRTDIDSKEQLCERIINAFNSIKADEETPNTPIPS